MESFSIPITAISTFGYVSECMGSWIQHSSIYWYRLHLTSPLLENSFSIARNYCSSTESFNPYEVWSLDLHKVYWCVSPPSIYSFNYWVHCFWLCFFLLSWSNSLLTLLSTLRETLTLFCCYFFLECNYDSPVRQLFCTVCLYAYNRRF